MTNREEEDFLARFDRRNLARTKRENAVWQESRDLRHLLSTDDGRRVSIEVVPRGMPTQDWDVLGVVVYPLGWLRHRLLHRGEYKVVVLEQRRHGWLDKTLHRTSGVTLDAAKHEAKRLAAEWSRRLGGTDDR